jgi:peptidoglycan/LPS O-acetylase OafA/YrhL
MTAPTRLTTLDGLRGLAAILVMLFHAGSRSPLAMPGGYLAVDLFFALSGFVLARAYEHRLRAGLGLPAFLIARLVRVAPMALIGAALGVALWNGRLETILLIPDFTSDQNLFPTNPPLWSLLFELIVNAAWALVAVRIGWRGLLLVLAISGGVTAEAIWLRGSATDLGSFWFTAAPGLIRTVFSFTLGVALFRLAQHRRIAARRSPLALLLFPVLTAALAFAPEHRAAWDIACILAIMPALLWLGARWELPAPALGRELGDLSFPLYCIHVPILALFHGSGAAMAGLLVMLALIASALDRWLDRPLRSLLTGLLRPLLSRLPA